MSTYRLLCRFRPCRLVLVFQASVPAILRGPFMGPRLFQLLVFSGFLPLLTRFLSSPVSTRIADRFAARFSQSARG